MTLYFAAVFTQAEYGAPKSMSVEGGPYGHELHWQLSLDEVRTTITRNGGRGLFSYKGTYPANDYT